MVRLILDRLTQTETLFSLNSRMVRLIQESKMNIDQRIKSQFQDGSINTGTYMSNDGYNQRLNSRMVRLIQNVFIAALTITNYVSIPGWFD